MTKKRLDEIRALLQLGGLRHDAASELFDAYVEAHNSLGELRLLLVTTIGGLGKAVAAIERWQERHER